jgi:nicotinate-nucleotide pyrophosphorylase
VAFFLVCFVPSVCVCLKQDLAMQPRLALNYNYWGSGIATQTKLTVTSVKQE